MKSNNQSEPNLERPKYIKTMNKLFLLSIFISGFLVTNACTQTMQKKNEPETMKNEQTLAKSGFISVDDAAKNALKVGDMMPAFELPNAKNETIKSVDLLKDSNLIVVFYRGDWCPYCNLYLKRLQENNQEFIKNGGKLVAISVENPDSSLSVTEKNKLEFEVLSDKNLDLARKFKLVYELPQETDEKYKGFGVDLVKDNGTAKPELPISATYIVNKKGEITYAFLDPDYKKRLDADVIIAELKKIKS